MSDKKRSPLPAQFLVRLDDIYGSLAPAIERTFVVRPTTLRVNTLRANVNEVRQELTAAGIKLRHVPWCSGAFVLADGNIRELEQTPAYREGRIYLQSLASMVPPLVLDPKPNEQVWDMTAAPGSKTSQIAALMAGKGRLVASEENAIRFERLQHNMRLLGVDAIPDFVELCHGDAIKIGKRFVGTFDKILIDAPCSAEARMVANNRRSFGYWNEKNIATHASLQRKLLAAAWTALRPGGTLVYSTCTFAPEENEVVIDELCALFSDVIIVPIAFAGLSLMPGITVWQGKKLRKEIVHTRRIMPSEEIEGFFVAKLQKKK